MEIWFVTAFGGRLLARSVKTHTLKSTAHIVGIFPIQIRAPAYEKLWARAAIVALFAWQ